MIDDTICAISSAVGDGAISIVRLSGSKALKNINKSFSKNLDGVDTHTIHYGHIIDDAKIVDEVLVSVMKAPKTYTTEDVVEIYCHGGYAITHKILEIVLNNGARLATPGEFTKRAFLNGRIDLTQAEAVSDIIKAKTQDSLALAMNSLQKGLSTKIETLREAVLQIIASIEVNIDYPEYDSEEVLTKEVVVKKISAIKAELEQLLLSARDGKIIEQGLKMAIIGSPNVGKSSILNSLIQEEKAIVTHVAGTTRDVIETDLIIGGVLFNLSDTAGIRQTEDVVEAIGVKKSLEQLANSDIVLLVVDGSRPLNADEVKLLNEIKMLNHIVVINKVDLKQAISFDFDGYNVVKISALNNYNLKAIETMIIEVLKLANLHYGDQTVVSKARHLNHLQTCLNAANDVLINIDNGLEIDLISMDINTIYYELGNILGLEVNDDILDRLFSEFCLGK